MRRFGILVSVLVAACNYDTGECFLREEEGGGVGGGVIISSGAGGFGDVPPKPQGAPAPVDPCLQTAECVVTWKADSDVCKGQGKQGNCTTLYQGKHASLSEAKEQCEKIYGVGNDSATQSCGPCQWETSTSDCKRCKLECDKEHDACHAKCSDSPCHAKCNDAYGKCLKECGDCPH